MITPSDTEQRLLKETRETREAITRIRNVLADTKVWEDLQVVSLELADATDDLNDRLARAEQRLLQMRALPMHVPMPDPGSALLWTGYNLEYFSGKGHPFTRLLVTGRRVRLACVPALLEILKRAAEQAPSV